MKAHHPILVGLGACALVCAWSPRVPGAAAAAPTAPATPPPPKAGYVPTGFTVPVYERGSNRIKALLRGQGRFELRTAQQRLEQVQVDYYDERNRTNLTILGTNCVYDFRNSTAVSPDPLRVLTGDGRLDLRGVGFCWQQTNNDLFISNDVITVVRKRLGPETTPPPEHRLEVRSDRLHFLDESNLIIYTGRVRVTDARFDLTCATLTIRRSPTNSIERVEATDHVTVSNHLDHSVTTAQRGVYVLQGDQEQLELSGRPFWTDGVREGRAERFLLDRRANTLTALGAAQFKLPRSAQMGLGLWSGPAAADLSQPAATPRFLDVAAGIITLSFPPTNGPVRSVLARTNVVIFDHGTSSRATADLAILDEDSVLTLHGTPAWCAGDREIHAGLLAYDTRRQHFDALTNVSLRFPVLALSQPLQGLAGPANRPNTRPATNHFAEIHSAELRYRDGWLTFSPAVRARYLEGTQSLGRLACGGLALKYSNRLERLDATGGFRLEQEPTVRWDGMHVARRLQGATLGLTFRTNGTLERIAADGQVRGASSDQRPGAAQPTEKHIECDACTATIRAGTNFVEEAIAQGHVRLRQEGRLAEADRACYSDTNGWLVLTGAPVITLPEGRITDATTVVWERATERYRVTGRFKSQWKRLPFATNVTNLRLTR
jgi:lipopolysaccharide export system protein LptA